MKEGVYMKKLLCSLVLAGALLFGATFTLAIDTQYYTKIRENYKQIKATTDEKEIAKLRVEITDLKAKSAEIKAEHNKKFESYLTEEQIKTLQYMREMKKEGKSCCPCGKNRYY